MVDRRVDYPFAHYFNRALRRNSRRMRNIQDSLENSVPNRAGFRTNNGANSDIIPKRK